MIINTLAPLPLRRIGDRTEISKLLLTAWSFWWLALLQEPTQNHFIGTKDTPVPQEIPKDLGVLCEMLLLPL